MYCLVIYQAFYYYYIFICLNTFWPNVNNFIYPVEGKLETSSHESGDIILLLIHKMKFPFIVYN
jgi:hypothetical protein